MTVGFQMFIYMQLYLEWQWVTERIRSDIKTQTGSEEGCPILLYMA